MPDPYLEDEQKARLYALLKLYPVEHFHERLRIALARSDAKQKARERGPVVTGRQSSPAEPKSGWRSGRRSL